MYCRWDWGTPLAFVCPFPNPPHPWSPASEHNRKGVFSAHLRRMAGAGSALSARPPVSRDRSAQSAREQRQRSIRVQTCVPLYMLHRMYICWEHARFCVSPPCVLRPLARGPCQEGGHSDAPPFPPSHHRPRPVPASCPPVCPCPQLCPRFDRPEAATKRGHPSNFLYI